MIPEKFKERMKPLLGDEFDEFINALEGGDAVRALRVNTLKLKDGQTEGINVPLSPIEYIPNAYFFDAEKVGDLAFHHSGSVYCQDPSAMCTVEAAREYIRPDMTALDLCSAPGGKSTQLAEMIPDGILYFNEFERSRAAVLRSNIERIGVRNSVITSTDTKNYAENFSGCFDLVLTDAPCSGEGMFRKYDDALTCWSEENIKMCASRQKEILSNAAKCVAGGGILIYSTCTFAPEENEEVIDSFLSSHGDFHIVPAADRIKSITKDGLTLPHLSHDMSECRRFYPHVSFGEGQFICIMKKEGDEKSPLPRIKKTAEKPLSPDDANTVRKFFNENLSLSDIDRYRFSMLGSCVMMVPNDSVCPDFPVLCLGTAAGEIQKGRFVPHHHLFSAFGSEFRRKVSFSPDSDEMASYLRGETVSVSEENGWCAVLYKTSPLGGGKVVDGVLKNHYPKGLRNKQ